MIRVGRGRELAWSALSKFKMGRHHFSTFRFPSHRVCLESSFSSVRGTGVKCLRSVRSVQLISRTHPALARTDLAAYVRLRLGSIHSLQLFGSSRRAVLGAPS